MKKNEIEKEYWKNFYNKTGAPSGPSSFCLFVDEYFKEKEELNILDVGCGNGRDSYHLSQRHQVVGVDNSSHVPKEAKNVKFLIGDFCNFDKKGYDLIYSRFTFHSITNDQHIDFLSTIHDKGTYLCIETRSDKGKEDSRHHGDDHYRNFTNSDYLKSLLKKYDFKILYFEEDKDFAIYKDENPVCIRVICIKE